MASGAVGWTQNEMQTVVLNVAGPHQRHAVAAFPVGKPREGLTWCWGLAPGQGRRGGAGTCREEAGHWHTQCGRRDQVNWEWEMCSCAVGLPQDPRLRRAAGGLERGLCVVTLQHSKAEGRDQTPGTPELARVIIHDICLLMALTNLLLLTRHTSQVFA